MDISAGGLAFKNIDCRVGDVYRIDLQMPGSVEMITVDLTILSIDGRDICHCQFKNLTEEQEEVIHQYVLERQKGLMQELKRR